MVHLSGETNVCCLQFRYVGYVTCLVIAGKILYFTFHLKLTQSGKVVLGAQLQITRMRRGTLTLIFCR